MNYLVTIGLEVHTTVKSEAKMFSAAKNSATALPNTCVDWIDLGLPGTLPTINLTVVKKAIQLGAALNMTIQYQHISFDRKNYFYYDLPKGFQITQYHHPIAVNGMIILPQHQKQIRIQKIQIEEDTAKQFSGENKILLDYNRSSAPLLEIVSAPDFSSAADVLEFLTYLKRTITFLEISDGKIELGNLRVDLNISLRKNLTDSLGTKVEVKNIGSFSAISKAIAFEIKRQAALLDQNLPVKQTTRKWNELTNQTEFMRAKGDEINYQFMPEPNIPEFSFSDAEYQSIITKTPKNWVQIATELKGAGLSEVDVDNVLDHYDLYLFLKQIFAHLHDWKEAYKWGAIEILGVLNGAGMNFEALKPQQFFALIQTIIAVKVHETLNAKQAKIAIDAIIKQELSLEEVITLHKMEQIVDYTVLKTLVEEILKTNALQLPKFLDNEVKFEKFVIGQIMAKTKGQANPKVAKKVYDEWAKPLLNKKI